MSEQRITECGWYMLASGIDILVLAIIGNNAAAYSPDKGSILTLYIPHTKARKWTADDGPTIDGLKLYSPPAKGEGE